MEGHRILEIGQMLYYSGNSFLDILIDRTSMIDRSIIEAIPIVIDNHAITVVKDNIAMTVTVIDSRNSEECIHIKNIANSYIGYTHRLHHCPQYRLPQGIDEFCTAWSLYAIYLAHQGIDPTRIIYHIDRIGLESFLNMSLTLIQDTSIQVDMQRMWNIIINYQLNNVSTGIQYWDEYRNAIDKTLFMDTIDMQFSIMNKVCRSRNEGMFLIYMLNILYAWKVPYRNMLISLASSISIQEMIDILISHLDHITVIMIIFITFNIVDKDLLILDINARDKANTTFTKEEVNIIDKYVFRYKDRFMDEVYKVGIIPYKYKSSIDMINDALPKIDMSIFSQ